MQSNSSNMANTYTQLLVQIVIVVQGRKNFIRENYRVEVEKYMCGIINNKKSKPLAIYCNPDHCHILIGLNPSISVSDLTRDIKANSARWINDNKWINAPFSWQKGFGAFSYSRSQLDRVVRYIHNQPEHHQKKTFREEYMELLDEFSIGYDERYVFTFYD